MEVEVDKTIVESSETEKVDRIGQLTREFLENDKSKTQTQHMVKAHIASLVSALGGPDHTSDIVPTPYKLGVNALVVFKDLKRWLKFDQSSRKWDVALACGETGLVNNDLVTILCQWERSYEDGTIFQDNKVYKDRIAGLCLELLVPLTWPLELSVESSVNQVSNYSKVKNYQLLYKKHMLSYDNGRVFKALVRLMIPIISLSKHKRSVRDNNILNICLSFFRNILAITPDNTVYSSGKDGSKLKKKLQLQSQLLPHDFSDDDISLDITIKVLHDNKVLKFFLTLFSGLKSEFDESILAFGSLECLYYLTNGVKVSSVFNSSRSNQSVVTTDNSNNKENSQPSSTVTSAGSELQDLLLKEKKLKSRFIKESASRHSRFGSLLSLETIETGRVTISGPKALVSTEQTLKRLNDSKKWNAQSQRIIDQEEDLREKQQYLSQDSLEILKNFVENFIDGGFNHFVKTLGARFAGDSKLSLHCIQFCASTSWLLQYERLRRTLLAKEQGKPNDKSSAEEQGDEEEDELSEFGLVASVLLVDHIRLVKMFISDETIKNKEVSTCQAVLLLLKETCLLLHEMSKSDYSQDVDISLNTTKILFTDENFLRHLVDIAKSASNKSLSFVVTVVEFLDVVFKVLESVTKDDSFVIVKRLKKKTGSAQTGPESAETDNNSSDKTKKSLRIKEFRFNEFFFKFSGEQIIDTYMRLISEFDKIEITSLKQAIRFFYRLYFTYRQHSQLLRLDFLQQMYEMLSPKNRSLLGNFRPEMESFFKHYMRSLRGHLDKTPILCVELLFPKIKDFAYYFDTGEKPTPGEINSAKESAEMKKQAMKEVKPIEFKVELGLDQKIGILVTDLIEKHKEEILKHMNENMKVIINDWHREIADKIDSTEAQRTGAQDSAETVDRNGSSPDTNLESTSESLSSKTLKLPYLNDAMKTLAMRNSGFRLLLKLFGFQLPNSYGKDLAVMLETELAHFEKCRFLLERFLTSQFVFNEGETLKTYTKKVYERKEDSSSDENEGEYSAGEYESDGDFIDDTEKRVADNDNYAERDGEDEEREPRLKNLKKKKKKDKEKDKDKKKKKKKRVEKVDKDETTTSKRQKAYTSSMYIDSEDDVSDTEADKQFFEKEQKLRLLIDRNNGIVTKDLFEQYNNDYFSIIDNTEQPTEQNFYEALKNQSEQSVEESQVTAQSKSNVSDLDADSESESSSSSEFDVESEPVQNDSESESENEIDPINVSVSKVRPAKRAAVLDEDSEDEGQPVKKQRTIVDSDEED